MLDDPIRRLGILPELNDDEEEGDGDGNYLERKHDGHEVDDYTLYPLPLPYGKDRHWKGRFAKMILTLLAIWGMVNILWHLWDTVRTITHRQGLSCRCGDSIAEAKKNGCVYDPLQLGWAPPHCRDDQATNAFRHAAPAMFGHRWPYYAKQDANSPLLQEQDIANFADTGQVYFTVHAHHLAHCMFIWMKEARVPETRSMMPKRFGGDKHAEHCAMVAMTNETLDALVSVSSVSLDLDTHSKQSNKFHALKAAHSDNTGAEHAGHV